MSDEPGGCDVMDILGAMDTNELIPRGLLFTLHLCDKK